MTTPLFIVVKVSDRVSGVQDVEDVADVFRNEPRIAILNHGAHLAFIEPELGWQAGDVLALALILS